MEQQEHTSALHVVSLFLLTFLLMTGGPPLSAQWLSGYSHRQRITVDESLNQGSLPLSDFPMLIRINDTLMRSASYGGYVQFTDGRDLCFTDQDSTTVLDFEVENYDPETGSLSAWVRIPSVSADINTELYLYFGNPDGLNLQDTAGVWSNGYTAVWHMADDPSDIAPQIRDATSFTNHGSTQGSMTADDLVDGKIHRAIQFDGTDDYATMPVSGYNTGMGAAEMWIKLDSMPLLSSDYFFAHRQEEPISDRTYLRVWPSGEWGSGMGDTYDLVRGNTLDTVSWHHLAISWNGTELTGYLDGAQDFGPVAYSGLDTVREIYVMTWMPSSESASGTLDELRVSGIERDSAWMAASYLIQNQPEAFYVTQTQLVNDMPCNALQLEPGDTCAFSIHTNIGAEDSGIPPPACGNYAGGDIWFYLIVPGSGSIDIQTDTETEAQYPYNNGWMYRAAMALYTGECDSLVLIGCYENNSIYHPRMAGAQISGQTPGDTIWVRIWENTNNDIGKFKICARIGDECPCHADFTLSGGAAFCEGDTGVSLVLSGSEIGCLYTLILNDSIKLDTLQGTGESLIWSPVNAPGWYKIEAHHPSDSCLLVMTDSTEVIRNSLPQLSFQATPSSCGGADDGSILTSISGGAAPYVLAWSGPGGFASSEENLEGLAPGEYSLSVTDGNFCVNTGPGILITEPPRLTASVDQVEHLTHYEGEDGAIQISIAGGFPPYAVLWTGSGDYVSTEEDPSGLTIGYYDVMVTDNQLCRDSIPGILVSVEDDAQGVFIPEGFSPNGDGYNDLFVILGIENHSENELVIFNTKGVVVYQRKDYKNDWDGTPETGAVLGGTLPEGTYYYVFKYGNTSLRKGFVYLNRE